jgi:cell division protein FtsW (lipid II flippase)
MAVGVAVTALLLMGLAGIQRGDQLADSSPLLNRQVLWVVLAVGAAGIGLAVPYRTLRGWTMPLYLVTVCLLVAVYFFPAKNGSRRWIPLGFMDFQPSELAKLAYAMALSEYLMFRRNHRRVLGLIPPFLMTLIPVILILREPDLGTSLLFFPVLFSVLLTAGARLRHLLVACVLGLACLPLLWSVMSAEQKSRITAVFQQRDDGTPDLGDGYHLYQSKQVLALGGAWGSDLTGMPVADPAAYRLPASRTDFIFCLIGERWGLPGTVGVLLLFGLLLVGGLQIASRTKDPFGRLLATGVTCLIAFQALLNMSMTVGLAPITGVTLPLLSYGGSSLLMTVLSLALVVNIGLRPGFDVTGDPFRFSEES